MTTPHTTAIRQAAEEINHLTGDDRDSRINVEIFEGAISRHLLPLLEQAESKALAVHEVLAKEREAYRKRECHALEVVAEYLDVLENAPDELTTNGLRGLFAPGNWSDVLSQRDQALARAEQAEKENQTLRVAFAVADDQSEHCQSLVAGLEQERDTALAKLAACEGLLREAESVIESFRQMMGDAHPDFGPSRRAQEPVAAMVKSLLPRISAHLSKQEPAP